MIQRRSQFKLVATSVAAVLSNGIIATNAQATPPPCSCSPRSYTFRLSLDESCSSSTLIPNNENGISNTNCQITPVTLRRRRLQQQGYEQPHNSDAESSGGEYYYYPVWNGGGYCQSDTLQIPSPSSSGRGGMQFYQTATECCKTAFPSMPENDCLIKSASSSIQNTKTNDDGNDFDSYYLHLQSQLHFNLPTVTKSLRQPPTENTDPSYISTVYFFEFDTSGALRVINEDDSLLSVNHTNLTDGATITFNSISRYLDESMALEDQLDVVPGGAGLFMFGNNEEGEIVSRGRMVWEFTNECDVAPHLTGETLGWVGFVEITPALHDFCPVFTKSPTSMVAIPKSIQPTTSSPSMQATDSPHTDSPQTSEPTITSPTIQPLYVATKAPSKPRSPEVQTTLAPATTPEVTKAPSQGTASPDSAAPIAINTNLPSIQSTVSPNPPSTPMTPSEKVLTDAPTPKVTTLPSHYFGIPPAILLSKTSKSSKSQGILGSKSQPKSKQSKVTLDAKAKSQKLPQQHPEEQEVPHQEAAYSKSNKASDAKAGSSKAVSSKALDGDISTTSSKTSKNTATGGSGKSTNKSEDDSVFRLFHSKRL